jgi:protein SCO1/2
VRKRISGPRALLVMLGILVVTVVPWIVIPTLACRGSDPVLDDLGGVGPFQLTDERGERFTEEALYGHVTLVSFLFTRCDTICPVTTMKMQRLQDKTFDAGTRIKLLSFSVDPGYDTPERLAAYAQRYHADAARWRFVTGPVQTMHDLIEGPLMNSMANEGKTATGAPAIAHSGHFLLIDPKGRIRGAYDSGDIQRLDEMVRDARFLARTVK